jgi:hypothetical protein
MSFDYDIISTVISYYKKIMASPNNKEDQYRLCGNDFIRCSGDTCLDENRRRVGEGANWNIVNTTTEGWKILRSDGSVDPLVPVCTKYRVKQGERKPNYGQPYHLLRICLQAFHALSGRGARMGKK